MEHTPKEGAGRPLYVSAPILQNGDPAKQTQQPSAAPALPARPAWQPGPGYLAAALLSYPLAWFYTRYLLFSDSETCRWSMPLFAVLYLAGVSLFAWVQKRPACKECTFWAVCWLVQSLAVALYGSHDVLSLWQWAAWHATAVLWTMSRTGMFAAGKSGIWTPLDLLMGVTALPWRDFFLRIVTWFGSAAKALHSMAGTSRKKLLGILFSVVVALVLCLLAWEQLAGVDATFARLADRLLGWLDWSRWLSPDTIIYLILSLPVGAWLFGLAGGGLRRKAPPVPAQRVRQALDALPDLPSSTGYLVPGALCAVYTLFFGLQAAEFATALGQGGLSAGAASEFAVTGFWELCRILMLDFAVLVALELFGGPLRTPGRRRLLLTLFGVYGLAFVFLAGAKLGAYIWLYGPTPLRMFSGWFLAVLGVWCLLALVWLWRPVPAARLGILVLAASFAVFCCLPVEQICIGENIRRCMTGQTEDIDVSLMWQCDNGGRLDGYIAAELVKAGWFEGRTADSVGQLYYDAADTWNGNCTIWVQGDLLQLTFQQGVCTDAVLNRAAGR